MISLEDAKAHLRLEPDFTDEDDLIRSLVAAAILSLEHQTGRALRDREETLLLDRWESAIKLPWWPVRAVNEIRYLDPAGVEQILEDYFLDCRQMPAQLSCYPASAWPAVANRPQAIAIKVQVGEEALPEDLKRAALLLVGNLYEHREAVVVSTVVHALPLAVDYLISPYRIPRIA